MLAPFGILTGTADDSDDRFVQDQLGTADPNHPIWPALNAVFARPWFSRMWVIQAFVCARKCTYLLGDMDLDHDIDFMTAPIALSMTANMSTMRAGKHDLGNLNAFLNATELTSIKSAYEGDGLGSLHEVLALTYGFDASDPLDRVFAVIGLLSEEQQVKHEWLIDYDQTLVELLLKVTKAFVLRSEDATAPGLSVLSHIIKSETRPRGLPSWVPEWRFKNGLYLP